MPSNPQQGNCHTNALTDCGLESGMLRNKCKNIGTASTTV
eukprot:CAMPEP_0203931338 /NCGR_PEP_ID=MMETSP0359-20131031/69935_1 /ASSEMBLY_ACC=CAM_ASM_000338 /TAXON_ID=268821 /ORGANISM="Scrippsiella Hangoei, Strain SHTV-5" /LENGTH=39 /DNA_ID= /DNA_START= /DNA_END= /DNA_ORIENTATION=